MNKQFAYILIICGLVGLIVSFLLTIDIIKLSADPLLDLPCNLNPFISCTSVINSSQGKVFGFPNPLLGIAGFTFIVATGVIMLCGGEPNKRFWNLFTIGITLAILLIHWFIFESLYVLGSLCLYCMITWAVTWPIFLYSVKNFQFQNPNFQFIKKNHLAILIGWYLLIIFLILLRFREYFIS